MITYCKWSLRSGDHFELVTKRGVLVRVTKDARWTYDLAYVFRGARFDHTRRILFTGCGKVILSFVIQRVACLRISSTLPPQ